MSTSRRDNEGQNDIYREKILLKIANVNVLCVLLKIKYKYLLYFKKIWCGPGLKHRDKTAKDDDKHMACFAKDYLLSEVMSKPTRGLLGHGIAFIK